MDKELNTAIIPVKKNSTRLPGKNTLDLAGKPLYEHTLDAVLNAGVFDQVIVSTDDDDVKERLAQNSRVSVAHRPASLADQVSTVAQVCMDILSTREIIGGNLGVFLPTTPFRTEHHIKEAWEIFKVNGAKTVSVKRVKVPRQFLYESGEAPLGKAMVPGDYSKTNSRGSSPVWMPNGAIFICKVAAFTQTASFYDDEINLYPMNEKDSLDIDTELDFKLATLMSNAL